MKKTLIIASVAFLVGACGANLVQPIQADVERGSDQFEGLTLNNLKEGKRLYEENCGLCHGKKKLDARTEEEWRDIVPRMTKKANGKRGEKVFTEEKEQILLEYILVMKDAPKRDTEE